MTKTFFSKYVRTKSTYKDAVGAALALSAIILLMPANAEAQQLDQLIQWVVTNAGRPAINAGVIGVAMTMLFFRMAMTTIAAVAGGGLLFANYDQISGMFGV